MNNDDEREAMEDVNGAAEAAAAAQRAPEMVGEAAAREAAGLAAAAAAGAGADGGGGQGLQQPPGLQRPPVGGESRESQRQRAQEPSFRQTAQAAAARAAAAAAAAVADESNEVKRLSLLPRAVVAFRKPVGIEGWKDARAMEAASAQMLRSTAVGTYGMVHALRPQGKVARTGRRTRLCARARRSASEGSTSGARSQMRFSRSRSARQEAASAPS